MKKKKKKKIETSKKVQQLLTKNVDHRSII